MPRFRRDHSSELMTTDDTFGQEGCIGLEQALIPNTSVTAASLSLLTSHADVRVLMTDIEVRDLIAMLTEYLTWQ